MRTNLPVTQQEYAFPASETLLSTTDRSSNITQRLVSAVKVFSA